MRKTTSGGRKIYTAIEARIRADDINAVHGTTLVLQGGGPMRARTQDRTLDIKPLSPWLTRQDMITWLDAFELGIVYATKGPEAAAGIVEPEGSISQEGGEG